jgi:ATP-binding cassette subfamily F protein 3
LLLTKHPATAIHAVFLFYHQLNLGKIMLDLNHIHLQFGTQFVFDDLNFSLYPKQKTGLIGKNGAGKTSLFKIILDKLPADRGEVKLHKGTLIASIEQEIADLSIPALHFVIAGHKEVGRVYLDILKANENEEYEKLAELYQELDELQGYDIEAKASEILHGLGFDQDELQQSIKSFSGGWRVRLGLARCLLAPSHILLLDEPTNHLDLDAQIWLEKYLQNYDGSILLISHDRDFLDNVCNQIAAVENKKITLYKGNYSQYEDQHAMQLALQEAQFKKQEKQRAHLESFVNRFKAKASKAKQAQSRMKMLAKLPNIARAQVDSGFSFEFPEAKLFSSPILVTEKLAFAYEVENILENVNISIANNARIGLLGLNGAGKTTFIKLIADQLQATSGELIKNKDLNIGYFAQHQLEVLNGDASAFWHLQKIADGKKEAELRSYLGGFGFQGDQAITKKVEKFSGGEKARLALALIIWQNPNLLLLDEPTNHLDISMREALTIALQSYQGALIVVAHDRHLLKNTVDEFFLVHDKDVRPFDGDLDDYSDWLQELKRQDAIPKKKKKDKQPEKKQDNSKQLQKLEKQIASLNNDIEKLDKQLHKPNLFEEDADLFLRLSKERKQLSNELELLEEQWLQLSDS